MTWADPNEIFAGTTLLLAPHMDDDVLACGGTIAQLQHKGSLHLAYATDGSMSPVPAFSWQGSSYPDLPQIRRREARSALEVLEVPKANIHFLDLLDGRLDRHIDALRSAVLRLVIELAPDIILIPFRYDRHPDHLALHRTVVNELGGAGQRIRLIEYFVYYRWQLLPGKDLRAYLHQDQLLQVDITAFSDKKRRALACFQSQTTCFFEWQDRPILPSSRVEEVSRTPELFLEYNPACAGAKVFASSSAWIRAVHTIEPPLKKIKDGVLTLTRGGRWHGRNATN